MIALVDDDVLMTDILKEYIATYEKQADTHLGVDVYHNATEFLENYKKQYSIICMDIDMPGMNGMEAARRLRELDEDVILLFITNLAQYAIDGYAVQATDFVVKPVYYEDFAMKLRKALRYVKRNEQRTIALKCSDHICYLQVDQIRYVEVFKHYLVYHTADQEYTVRGTIDGAEKKLGMGFSRCGRSILVNLRYVTGIRNNAVLLQQEELPLSRGRKEPFMQALAQYVGGM